MNLLSHLPSNKVHEFFASSLISGIENKLTRIKICQFGLQIVKNDWQLFFRSLIRHDVLTDDPLHLFNLLNAIDLFKPEFMVVCYQIKRPINLRKIFHGLSRNTISDSLTFATNYATMTTRKQLDIVIGFNFLRPDHAILINKTQFSKNNDCMTVFSHVSKISKDRGIPDPTLDVFEGAKPTLDEFIEQYKQGKMEKYQLQDRLIEFCVNPMINRQIIEFVSIEYPTLAHRLTTLLNMQMSIPKPYSEKWLETQCNGSRELHSLITSDQKVFSINDNSGIDLALQLIRKKSLVILLSYPHNKPRRLKELAFVTIYIENYLFILKADSLIAQRNKVDSLFALLSKMKLYTQFGVQLAPMISNITSKYTPVDIVDHRNLSKEMGIDSSLNDLSLHLFNEPFCHRTLASPREKPFPNTMKDHLILQNRILHCFAINLISDPQWEKARIVTHDFFTKKPKAQKRKNDAT